MKEITTALLLVIAYVISYSIGYSHGKKKRIVEVHCDKTDCEYWDTCKLKSLCGREK